MWGVSAYTGSDTNLAYFPLTRQEKGSSVSYEILGGGCPLYPRLFDRLLCELGFCRDSADPLFDAIRMGP
jgi:hypothetical protein